MRIKAITLMKIQAMHIGTKQWQRGQVSDKTWPNRQMNQNRREIDSTTEYQNQYIHELEYIRNKHSKNESLNQICI